MKTILGFLAPLCATMAVSAAVPSVDSVAVTWQDGKARVTYGLSGECAIVTCDILTNGVSVAPGGFTHLTGDVHRIVDVGNRAFVWDATRALPRRDYGALNVSVVVDAWATNAPPDYMVVNLSKRGEVHYCADTNHFPVGALSADAYRRNWLPMRYIKAKGIVWMMGSPETEVGHDSDEVLHEVELDADYYMAVFPCTYGYLYALGGQWSYADNNIADVSLRAVYNMNRTQCRVGSDSKYYADHVYPNPPGSYVGQFRTQTGIPFDLPTEGQWEYAARAGCGTDYWGDMDAPLSGDSQTHYNIIRTRAWFYFKSWRCADTPYATSANTWRPIPVGRMRPNAWGLYDMFGMVPEACLDNYKADLTGVRSGFYYDGIAPKDRTSSNDSVVYKGKYYHWADNDDYSNVDAFRPAARSPQSEVSNAGFRIVCPVGAYGYVPGSGS